MIIKSIKPIIRNTKYVEINRDKIIELSKYFRKNELRHWLKEAPFDLSKLDDDSRLAFLFVFNAISFSYWGEPKWTIKYLGMKYDGSWGMIASLARAIEEGKPILDPHYLEKISKKDFEQILKGNVKIPLFEERLKIIREIGRVIVKDFNGRFVNVINSAEGNALKLLKIIIKKFPSFKDEYSYKNKKIYFLKRAQLLVSDIYHVFKGEGYGNLIKIDNLTACADYKLPQVLRRIGIIDYSKKLKEKIDNKIEIKKGSREELEIRANIIYVVELIKKELKNKIKDISSSEINDYIWLAGQIKHPEDKPYHRTRTTSY